MTGAPEEAKAGMRAWSATAYAEMDRRMRVRDHIKNPATLQVLTAYRDSSGGVQWIKTEVL